MLWNSSVASQLQVGVKNSQLKMTTENIILVPT